MTRRATAFCTDCTRRSIPSLMPYSRDRTRTVSGTVPARTTSVRSGCGTFLFRSQNMLSIFSVLSETVSMVSLSAPLPSRTYNAEQLDHITDNAGHQQTLLLMLAISRWLHVWHLRNRRVSLTAGVSYARTHVSSVHCSPAQTAFTNTHRPTWRPPLDKQCRSAIIIPTTVICHVTLVASDNWPSRCHLKLPTPLAEDHLNRLPPWHSATWVVVRGGW